MTSIDCNTSTSPTHGPWGRSPRERSPKYPTRKISFNGDRDRDCDSKSKSKSKGNIKSKSKSKGKSKIKSNDNDNDNDNVLLLSSSFDHRARYQHSSLHIPMNTLDFDGIPGLESSSSDNNNLYRRRLELEQQEHDTTAAMSHVVLRKAERRASTGTRPIARPGMVSESECALLGCYSEQKKSRRVSISGPRPCMEATFGSLQANQRRCAKSWRGDEAAFDEPILRPYRQLSSENLCGGMCIGEETDEDLSNRTFRTTDNNNNFSNRSNRSSCLISNRSNRNRFIPPGFQQPEQQPKLLPNNNNNNINRRLKQQQHPQPNNPCPVQFSCRTKEITGSGRG